MSNILSVFRLGLLCFGLSALSVCAYSQGKTPSLADKYAMYKDSTASSYVEFRREANTKYAEFMRQSWKTYRAFAPVPLPVEPKVPVEEITEEELGKPLADNGIELAGEVSAPRPVAQPIPPYKIPEVDETALFGIFRGDKAKRQAKRERKAQLAAMKKQMEEMGYVEQEISLDKPDGKPQTDVDEPLEEHTLRFHLYGTPLTVRTNDSLMFKLPDCTRQSLTDAWERMSKPYYNNLIRDCLELRFDNKYCDWTYLRMLDEMSQELLGRGTDEATLLKAFVFCQSGYKMRLATEKSKLVMLYATNHQVMGKLGWYIDEHAYYSDGATSDELDICPASYPKEQPLSLYITGDQDFAPQYVAKRPLVCDRFSAELMVDKNEARFCNDYPVNFVNDDITTRWIMYANMPMSHSMRDQLYPQIEKAIKGKSKAEAVDMLCYWIQKAFPYEYDEVVWGHDRAFFADETLYYPNCDCEDRAILLTRIVRDLLHLPCVLLYYPGHLASAIAFGEDQVGDFIRVNGEKYIVCDPTYIGAGMGRTMRGMNNRTAKVVKLD